MGDFKQYNLDETILEALYLLGYDQETETQAAVVATALAGRDMIVQAQTGTGKTAAYGIPLVQYADWDENLPQALVLTPTRELAMQVQQELAAIGRLKRLKVSAIYGQSSFHAQERDLKQKTHIVTGTPGRILDHLQRGTLPAGALGVVVIDEADEMLQLGFFEQVEEIMAALPVNLQVMLFSATLPERVAALAQQWFDDPVRVTVAESTRMSRDQISHYYYDATDWVRSDLLTGILIVRNPESCMIFANTREDVEAVRAELFAAGCSVAALHGGMMQEERTQVMGDFRKGAFRYLVATDVAGRGIDVANIDLVVNYELPYEQENYLHRTGRTGRHLAKGEAISLVTAREMRHLDHLATYIGQEVLHLPEPSYEEVVAARPAFLAKMAAERDDAGIKTKALEAGISKLRIANGKKSKIRATDIVGTICAIPGLVAEDIGVIDIRDWVSYVEILNNKGAVVLAALASKPLKGEVRKVVMVDE